MRLVDVSDIIVPEDRQRKSIDKKKLQELVDSIAEKGLLHPVVCNYDDEDDSYTLVAGGRRLRAIHKLIMENRFFSCDGQIVQPGQVPVVLVSDLDDIGLREAELEENIIRVDLTWQERVDAISELHELRKARNPQQTIKATAAEIAGTEPSEVPSSERERVSRALFLSQHLDDPDVARAKTDKEAFAIASRKTMKMFQDELAKTYTPVESPHTLIKGDLHKVMAELPEKEFDCIIADPPYGIDAEEFGDAAKLRHEYSDGAESSGAAYKRIIWKSAVVCKPQAHMYLFCDIDYFVELKRTCEDAGWKPLRTPLIWPKGGSGHLSMGGPLGFRRTYEIILFAHRGGKKLNITATDIIRDIKGLTADEKEHAAQKPVGLYSYFLSLSCMPGDKVLDPCCGSGTIFAAADAQKCTATGIEMSERYYEVAERRLRGLEGAKDGRH